MDAGALEEILIEQSKKDVFDGVGRVFLNEIKTALDVSEDDLKKAIGNLRKEYDVRIHDDKILLISLQPRPNRPFTLPGKFDE